MTEELRECYRKLAVEPAAPFATVDLSYQQLITVWNPERFADDPALQATAWRKLQELNVAYAQICAHAGEAPRLHQLPAPAGTGAEVSRARAPHAGLLPQAMRHGAEAETPNQKVLKRVRLVALLDGWNLVGFAVFGLLLALIFGDLVGGGVTLLIAVAGGLELHGGNRLKRRDAGGVKWLVRSQLLVLAVVLTYCASRLGSFDQETVMANLTPDMESILHEAGIEKKDILPLVRVAFFSIYGGVAVATVLYQGGMAWYYHSRRQRVIDALEGR